MAEQPLLVGVGARDALEAKLIAEAGFDFVWSSGFAISASYGVPDASLVSMTQVLEHTRSMADAIDLPIVADCVEVEDIISTVRELNERGAEFLYTPSTYYAQRPAELATQGVESIDEDWQVLEDLGILVDGSDEGYLLQIFMKEAAQYYDQPEAGPFFIELIQRKGDRGFGGGNFRALFEAIERDQLGELAGVIE